MTEKMVPREPTQVMIDAGCEETYWNPSLLAGIWAAMYDAAPAPSTPATPPDKHHSESGYGPSGAG